MVAGAACTWMIEMHTEARSLAEGFGRAAEAERGPGIRETAAKRRDGATAGALAGRLARTGAPVEPATGAGATGGPRTRTPAGTTTAAAGALHSTEASRPARTHPGGGGAAPAPAGTAAPCAGLRSAPEARGNSAARRGPLKSQARARHPRAGSRAPVPRPRRSRPRAMHSRPRAGRMGLTSPTSTPPLWMACPGLTSGRPGVQRFSSRVLARRWPIASEAAYASVAQIASA